MKRTALRRYTRLSPVSRKKRGEVRIGRVSGKLRLSGAAMEALRDFVYVRDEGRCQWVVGECEDGRQLRCHKLLPKCGSVFTRAHLAHIVGRGAGGSDTPENTRILCPEHHLISQHTRGEIG